MQKGEEITEKNEVEVGRGGMKAKNGYVAVSSDETVKRARVGSDVRREGGTREVSRGEGEDHASSGEMGERRSRGEQEEKMVMTVEQLRHPPRAQRSSAPNCVRRCWP